MANYGKDTNGSQFYILYKSARHLDFKHTVFGSVVGGFETLTSIEAVPTDSENCPQETIQITGVDSSNLTFQLHMTTYTHPCELAYARQILFFALDN